MLQMYRPPLFRSNYFHNELNLYEKSRVIRPFFMNTLLYPWNESTL
jgi:hypothetical protein